MRRLVALGLVALLALSLSLAVIGCGGGGSQEPAATPATPPAEPMMSDSMMADTAMAPH